MSPSILLIKSNVYVQKRGRVIISRFSNILPRFLYKKEDKSLTLQTVVLDRNNYETIINLILL